jgi:hypothetical protein
MPEPLCLYDSDYDYDSDVYWNGECAPEIIPVESLIRIGGRVPKKTKKVYCHVEFDTIFCLVNGQTVPLENLQLRKVRHVSEEEEEQKQTMVLESISIRKGNKLTETTMVNVETFSVTQKTEVDVVVQATKVAHEENKVNAEMIDVKPAYSVVATRIIPNINVEVNVKPQSSNDLAVEATQLTEENLILTVEAKVKENE